MNADFVTLNAPAPVRRALRLVSATTGEKQYEVLARLVQAEARRLGLAALARGVNGTGPHKGG
jgi:hypothetical protein